jgi:hypothetical protein
MYGVALSAVRLFQKQIPVEQGYSTIFTHAKYYKMGIVMNQRSRPQLGKIIITRLF